MNGFGEFLKTTFIGGFFIILPVGLLVLIVMKLVQMVQPVVVPLARFLPEPFRYPILLGLIVVFLISFAAGLLALTRAGRSVGKLIETSALNRIPGYQVFRSLTHRIGEADDASEFAPAFVEIEESLVLAFIIEELDDDKYTIFVPSVPTLAAGSVYVMDGFRVHPVDAAFMSVAKSITHFGLGSGELLKSLRNGVPAILGSRSDDKSTTSEKELAGLTGTQ
jgi:uncharacterized membrane protein